MELKAPGDGPTVTLGGVDLVTPPGRQPAVGVQEQDPATSGQRCAAIELHAPPDGAVCPADTAIRRPHLVERRVRRPGVRHDDLDGVAIGQGREQLTECSRIAPHRNHDRHERSARVWR